MAYSSAGLINLLQNKSAILGLEIGICEGTGADYILNRLPQLTLHGIDPYQSYIDWNGCSINCDADYQIAKKKLNVYGDRFIHHKSTSDDAAFIFSDKTFDYIFIDGLHTYEQVLIDCQNYYSKLKTGGVFAGHDFNTIEGVRRAVNEFSATVNKTPILIESDAWYWIK